ncbi:MAG: zf-TFIIB domain-containing protein [Planctomycetes bacterium]|nr:zf-TFIIB domain-containing protein [Planctomycetota bacterium]
MNCLRCANQVLDERVREGVVIDICPSCRGVWLDRGELEKLLARLGRDDNDNDDEDEDEHDDDDDDDDGRRSRSARTFGEDDDRRHPRRTEDRRGGWFDSISSMFD